MTKKEINQIVENLAGYVTENKEARGAILLVFDENGITGTVTGSPITLISGMSQTLMDDEKFRRVVTAALTFIKMYNVFNESDKVEREEKEEE